MGERREISRRALLTGGAVVVGGAAVAGAATASAVARNSTSSEAVGTVGSQSINCFGPHQAGIATAAQSHATFVAYDLRGDLDREALGRLMKVWSDDIARLTAGRPALADPVPELASIPANLSVTVGYGPGFFTAAGLQADRPAWLSPLPQFEGDALEERWSGGDLVVQVCADDPMTVSHATEVLTAAAVQFASPRWVQQGFHRPAGSLPPGTVGRNLMGFADGIANPRPDTEEFTDIVWNQGEPPWLRGGTALVLRRIRIDGEGWSALSQIEREQAVGRRADNGAPLTGVAQNDLPDLDARNPDGLSTIPQFAHIRQAAATADNERMLRRPYNYDAGLVPASEADAGTGTTGAPRAERDQGQIFAAYGSDVIAGFAAVQERLAESDLMHSWVTAVGSAVFAVPPGFEPGGWLGQSLLA